MTKYLWAPVYVIQLSYEDSACTTRDPKILFNSLSGFRFLKVSKQKENESKMIDQRYVKLVSFKYFYITSLSFHLNVKKNPNRIPTYVPPWGGLFVSHSQCLLSLSKTQHRDPNSPECDWLLLCWPLFHHPVQKKNCRFSKSS